MRDDIVKRSLGELAALDVEATESEMLFDSFRLMTEMGSFTKGTSRKS